MEVYMRNSLKIYKHSQLKGISNIILDNVDINTLQKCILVTRNFVKGDNLFLGHYRVDGINLSLDEFTECEGLINKFISNGAYTKLIENIRKKSVSYLTVGNLPVNDDTYRILPMLLKYYLETIYFCPKIDWDAFVKIYRNYMKISAQEFIVNGFTDIMFSHFDSCSFSISFNSEVYNINSTYNEIEKIVLGN